MKKIKSNEKIFIQKEYYKLIVFNLLSFLAIFVLLGFLSVTLINKVFFSKIKEDIEETEKAVIENIQYSTETDQILISNIKNARVLLVFYDETGAVKYYTNSILSYIIPDFEKYASVNIYDPNYSQKWGFDNNLFKEYVNEVTIAEKNSLIRLNSSKVGKYVMFETVETLVEKYSFMTKTIYIDNETIPQIKYVKILIMANGEINSRDQIVNVYVACATLMIIFGAFASIILSMNAIKPLVISLNKQMTFVSDASHELKTPLAIVQSKLENILAKSDKTVYDVSEDIAISLKEISRLSKLTSDLLHLAKIDASKEKLIFESVKINELIYETSSIFKEMAELQSKEFTLKLENVEALVDKGKITQLLVILLDNALRYTNEGDGITISLSSTASEFTLIVADTGIGISDETIEKIFERFYREDKARSRETGGNGLGLAIAKTIVSGHGGKIIATHNEPKGTKFIVTLPKKNKIKE